MKIVQANEAVVVEEGGEGSDQDFDYFETSNGNDKLRKPPPKRNNKRSKESLV